MNHIYLDLDGVLVNLEESFYNYYPNKPSHQTWQEYEKQNISKSIFVKIYEETDPYEFWSNLKPMNYYMDIVNTAIELAGVKNVSILSAPTKDFTTECGMGKIDWVRKHIPYNLKCNVVKRENKKIFAGKGKILVDDMSINVVDWTMHNGIGILHVHPTNTISELNKAFRK